jgi:hypothetical protein
MLMLAALLAAPGGWVHISSERGEIEKPNTGKEQTPATVFDIDRDGVNDFVITERTAAPPVVWYRRTKTGWDRYAATPWLRHIIKRSGRPKHHDQKWGDVDGGREAGTGVLRDYFFAGPILSASARMARALFAAD